MRLVREAEDGDFTVEVEDGFVRLSDAGSGFMIEADDAEVRWLQTVALPAALAEMARCVSNDDAEVPSEPPANVSSNGELPLDERGQIPGQLAID